MRSTSFTLVMIIVAMFVLTANASPVPVPVPGSEVPPRDICQSRCHSIGALVCSRIPSTGEVVRLNACTLECHYLLGQYEVIQDWECL
jgi:hypothetical protein